MTKIAKIKSTSLPNSIIEVPLVLGYVQDSLNLTHLRAKDVDHWFITTSDCGPNEVLARKYFAVLLKDHDNCFFLDANCFEHQAHLMVLSGLSLADKLLASQTQTISNSKSGSKPFSWRYYTSLAIVTNVLRSAAKDLYLQWCLLYGALDANKKVKKLFPKCQSGRWGSVHQTEERLIAAGFDQLREVVAILAKKFWGKKKQSRQANGDDKENARPASESLNPDTLALEQCAEYSKRMGKWRTYAIASTEELMWGRLIEISHWARAPIMHFTHFVRRKVPSEELHSKGHSLCQLINGKAHSIFAEFSEMLEPAEGILAAIQLIIL